LDFRVKDEWRLERFREKGEEFERKREKFCQYYLRASILYDTI
jgi:hypothetical protein